MRRSMLDRSGCDVPRQNLSRALDRTRTDLHEVRALLGIRNPEAGAALRRVMRHVQHVFSQIKDVCIQESGTQVQCCQFLQLKARVFYDDANHLHRLVERQAGEERMRAGYFGDLGRQPWKPRRRRGPMCRRVWVRSHYRI